MPRDTSFDEIVDALLTRATDGPAALLLDYDGTLVDIVPTPEQARLDDETRALLVALASHPRLRVAIITGRGRPGLDQVAGALPGVALATNGGLVIEDASGRWVEPHANALRPVLAEVAVELRKLASAYPGTLLEDKEWTLALHYRLAPEAEQAFAERCADIASRYAGRLRVIGGKRVFEIQPAVPWDKGAAANAVLDRWSIRDAVLFVGDDDIDEPAFEAVRRRGGLAVRVGGAGKQTAATQVLAGVAEMRALLRRLRERLDEPT